MDWLQTISITTIPRPLALLLGALQLGILVGAIALAVSRPPPDADDAK